MAQQKTDDLGNGEAVSSGDGESHSDSSGDAMPEPEFDHTQRAVLNGQSRVGATGLLVAIDAVIPPLDTGEYHYYRVSWPSDSATVDERELSPTEGWLDNSRHSIVLDAGRDFTTWLEHDHDPCPVCETTTRKCGNHRFADPFEECVGCGHTEYP